MILSILDPRRIKYLTLLYDGVEKFYIGVYLNDDCELGSSTSDDDDDFDSRRGLSSVGSTNSSASKGVSAVSESIVPDFVRCITSSDMNKGRLPIPLHLWEDHIEENFKEFGYAQVKSQRYELE